jgi:DNA-binding response OmpR family regulator
MMKRILIVEDDELIANLEKDYLTANDFEVSVAMDGRAGMEMFMEGHYDLLLLDVMLPGMDGFEICRIVRGESDVPIIMLTARKEDIDKIRGLGLGADDYMVKPFSPAEMVARVKAHIAIHERLKNSTVVQQEEKEIKIKDLRIIPGSRRVFLGAEEIKLVNKEYELLLFMAENPDMVLSKNMIYNHVWGMDALTDTSTVTVHIKRLREKIEKDQANPEYIETIWGAGYRMKAD